MIYGKSLLNAYACIDLMKNHRAPLVPAKYSVVHVIRIRLPRISRYFEVVSNPSIELM